MADANSVDFDQARLQRQTLFCTFSSFLIYMSAVLSDLFFMGHLALMGLKHLWQLVLFETVSHSYRLLMF